MKPGQTHELMMQQAAEVCVSLRAVASLPPHFLKFFDDFPTAKAALTVPETVTVKNEVVG